MGQFNNYFEENYVVDKEDRPYDVSNLWPSNRLDNQEKHIKICKAYGLIHDIDVVLKEREYVTEGDLRDVFELKSDVSNPFRFYDGNSDIYRARLLSMLEERKQKISSYRREVRLIEEALKDLS